MLEARRSRWRALQIRAFRLDHPPIHGGLVQAAAGLARDGVFISSIEALERQGVDLTVLVQATEAAIAARLRAAGAGSTVRIQSCDPDMPREAYFAGLQRPLVELVEHYLGLSAVYLGAEVKCERADGQVAQARHWHMDMEDDNVLKVLVYLHDVAAGGGAFEYIAAGPSQTLRRALRYRSGFLAETATAAAARTDCTGPAGTVIFFDGARLMHHTQPPVAADRLSVTLSYASVALRQVVPQARPNAALRAELAAWPGDLAARVPKRFLHA